MECPNCKTDDAGSVIVTDSRPTRTGIRRRRKCVACGHRWTTMESAARMVPGPGGQVAVCDWDTQPPATKGVLRALATLAETLNADDRATLIRMLSGAESFPDDTTDSVDETATHKIEDSSCNEADAA